MNALSIHRICNTACQILLPRFAYVLVCISLNCSPLFALQTCNCPETVKKKVLECLLESVYYDEIAVSFTRMQGECQDFITSLKQAGISMDQAVPTGFVQLYFF